MISVAEALAGRWGANVPGWLLATLPASLLVISQDVATPSLSGGAIFASILIQALACLAWGTLIAAGSRKLTGRITPVASGLLWVGLGVVRGLAGGAVAASNGADPDWVYRIVFWTGVTLLWAPLISYSLAQWDERRRLLGVQAQVQRALAEADERAAESAEARDRRLAEAVDDAIRPALEEVRDGLRESASSIDEHTLAGLVSRVDELAARTASFVTPAPPPRPVAADERVSLATAGRDFELSRPVLAAVLAALTTAPVIFPDALREGGLPHVAENALAVVTAAAFTIVIFVLLRPLPQLSRLRSVLSRTGSLVAGIAGALLLAALPWEPIETGGWVAIGLFPLVYAIGASTVATVVALWATGGEVAARAADDERMLARRIAELRAADERAAAGLVTLVRGELNGRLAACAMALGFLATGTLPTSSRSSAIASIIAQLDAVAADLDRVVSR